MILKTMGGGCQPFSGGAGGAPLSEGFDALGLGAAGFLGLRTSLLLLR